MYLKVLRFRQIWQQDTLSLSEYRPWLRPTDNLGHISLKSYPNSTTGISFHCNSFPGYSISIDFCTRYNSMAVASCPKIYSDQFMRIKLRPYEISMWSKLRWKSPEKRALDKFCCLFVCDIRYILSCNIVHSSGYCYKPNVLFQKTSMKWLQIQAT